MVRRRRGRNPTIRTGSAGYGRGLLSTDFCGAAAVSLIAETNASKIGASISTASLGTGMETFNYLSVLVSIILGLGITQLLSAMARAVEYRDAGTSYWPSITWFLLLLLAHIQTWWSFYGLHTHVHWNFLQFLFVLMQPIGLYLLSVLVLPSEAASSKGQKAWYFAHRRAFFALLVAFIATSLVRDIVVSGRFSEPLNAAFHLLLMLGSVAAAVTAREWFHRLFAITSLLLFVLYIALLFGRLGA